MPEQPHPSFHGEIRTTVQESTPWWPPSTTAPRGAPNILVVLFDDVGFSDFGCYGSPIHTPTIDRLAAQGVRYRGFHTTAMCSTTRAALLTGRNHHSVGVGCLANFDSGFPGYRGKIAKEAGTLAMAQRLVHQVVQVLAPGCVPLFLTDGFKVYLTALLTHYGQWVHLPRRQDKGPAPKPRWMPLPGLLYAQVVKTVRRRRLVRVQPRVVFGTLAAGQRMLTACGWQINTAFIERVNLSLRQHVAAVGRRVTTLCKGEDGLRQQLVLYHIYYNFCLPHASLRQPLTQPEPTKGTGSAKQWRPCTPAMAAGLTDHVWSLREVLLYRVPPWPQPVGV